MFGYALMAIVVSLGTLLILYLAYGYDIDRKTGTLIQNGIVFVDSKPQGARIFLNEVPQSRGTDTRLVLPAGVYTIRLEREGYRHWERTFTLDGGEIERLVYPFLLPNELVTTDVARYDATPGLAMQSPDRRWVLVQRPGQTYQFDVFDLADTDKAPATFIVPPAILSEPSADAALEFVEWSNDNRHVMVKRTYGEASEYLMLNHEKPEESLNINVTLGITPAKITLRDKKADQFYYLDAMPGVLRVGNTRDKTISAPLLSMVVDYQSYSDDILLFVTQEDVEAGEAEFRIREGDRVYPLKTVPQSDRYVLDVARYDGQWFYVAGAAADNMTFVYENPLAALKATPRASPKVVAIMRLDNPRFASFSANTQYVAVQSGNKLLTLDLEDRNRYRTILPHDIALAQQIKWMDGHRFIYTVNEQSFITDFDGSNQNTLVTSRLAPGPFFDRDYDNVLTFEESKSESGKKALTITVIED